MIAPEFQSSLQQEKTQRLVWFFSGIGTFAGGAVFLSFGILDYLMYPAHAHMFWTFRAVSLLSLVLIRLALSFFAAQGFRAIQIACCIPIVAAVSSIQAMVWVIDDHNSPYWAGLALMLAALSIGFSFSRKIHAFIIVYVIGNFLIYSFFYFQRTGIYVPMIQAIFLIGTALVSSMGRFFYSKLELRELEIRYQLNSELKSRAQIIHERTQQLTRLKSLSRQFSPRLISAIESGEISMDAPAVNRRICALVIDIKDSTSKLMTIAPENNQATLDLFMRDVMRVMNQYDLTIDKFVGDGIIGFTNAPLAQSDYIVRCLQAAIAIKQLLSTQAQEYEKLWGGPFEYRIGLGEGECAVGFYGSDEAIKTYTAIGQAINLANRINAKARVNSIAMSEDLKKRLICEASDVSEWFLFEDLGTHELKGFVEPIQLWDVSPKR